jgi:hypothetical protein
MAAHEVLHGRGRAGAGQDRSVSGRIGLLPRPVRLCPLGQGQGDCSHLRARFRQRSRLDPGVAARPVCAHATEKISDHRVRGPDRLAFQAHDGLVQELPELRVRELFQAFLRDQPLSLAGPVVFQGGRSMAHPAGIRPGPPTSLKLHTAAPCQRALGPASTSRVTKLLASAEPESPSAVSRVRARIPPAPAPASVPSRERPCEFS